MRIAMMGSGGIGVRAARDEDDVFAAVREP
jgi:hypothetical protein